MTEEDFLKARQEKEELDLIRLEKHRKIFSLLKEEGSKESLEKAFERINLWKKNQTCSDYYVEEWTKILNDLSLFEKIVLDPKNHHLRQNTPFRLKEITNWQVMNDIDFLEVEKQPNDKLLFRDMLGENGNTIPYKSLINISYLIVEGEYGNIYITEAEENKYLIECLTTKEVFVYLWCDGLILDFNLNFYFKLDNFQIDKIKRYIEKTKKINFIVYDEKDDKPVYKTEKIVSIL